MSQHANLPDPLPAFVAAARTPDLLHIVHALFSSAHHFPAGTAASMFAWHMVERIDHQQKSIDVPIRRTHRRSDLTDRALQSTLGKSTPPAGHCRRCPSCRARSAVEVQGVRTSP